MYRILIIASLALLFSCNQSNSFKKYENTIWTGPYGPWEMSLIIDKVKGNMFSGEMHKPQGRIAYFEGEIFPNDSLVMTELYHILGSGLVMDGTYPGKIEGDTLKGLCNFFNVHLPDTTLYKYHLIKDKNFKGKTLNQEIISNVFQETLPITKELSNIMKDVKNPFTELKNESKNRYAELLRTKRELYEKAATTLEDENMKPMIKKQFIQKTNIAWSLAKNSADSLWLINVIDQYKKGEDDYYSAQRMKLSITKVPREAYINFFKHMFKVNLTFNDQLSFLYDLMYSSEINDEIKSMFNERYSYLNKEYPDNKQLIRIGETLNKIEIANKIKPGTFAPLFELESLSGKKIKLSNLKGKFVFLDFWGTWCGPCRGEIPNVKELDETISKEKLQVIGIASDDINNLKNYIENEKILYQNILADESTLKSYGITGFPTTILIDPDGKILAKDLRGDNLVELVNNKMNEYYKVSN